jgi:hypothetical protein
MATMCRGQAVETGEKTMPSVRVTRCDPLLRLFPDRPPPPAYDRPAHVPRSGSAPILFAVTAAQDGARRLTIKHIRRDDGTALKGQARIYELLPVQVEGNTQGSMCSKPGGALPEGWLEHLVREAPFQTAEVLVEADSVVLSAGSTHGVLVDVAVDRDALPGTYRGQLELTSGDTTVTAAFVLQVYATVLPEHHALHSVHWLWPDPVNLTSGTPPEWWSDEHWALLEQAGRQLRAFGDDTMFTPLIEGEYPLITTRRRDDGTFSFDYTNLDRWVTTFRPLGFRLFSGRHLNHMGRNVYVRIEASGKRERPFYKDPEQKGWLAFLPVFLKDFHGHLEEKNWTNCFLQHQYDEPRDRKLYEAISAAVRDTMPGVGSIDAINSRPETFSPLVDHLVFNLPGIMANRDLAAERVVQGRRNWLYHCTSPYPPYPNRHIDCPLSASRLWPWICYTYKAQGFLFWAANLYRGVTDEYANSLGPMGPLKPGQKLEVGHPPGDDWFYYRGPDGLRPSVRILAFREGLTDHTLLSMLAGRDPARAHVLQDRIVGGVVKRLKPYPPDWSWRRYRETVNFLEASHSRTPADYHVTRAELLQALDQTAPAEKPAKP